MFFSFDYYLLGFGTVLLLSFGLIMSVVILANKLSEFERKFTKILTPGKNDE